MKKFYCGVAKAFCLFAAVGSLTGCSADVADEEGLDSVSQAFNASQCATATAVATLGGEGSWELPGDYGTQCNAVDNLGFLVDDYYSSTNTFTGGPNTKANCLATTIRSVFYTRPDSSSPWTFLDDRSGPGEWVPNSIGGGFYCTLSTGIDAPGVGADVRVATTVRRYGSGSAFKAYPFSTGASRDPR